MISIRTRGRGARRCRLAANFAFLFATLVVSVSARADEPKFSFDDPFLQVTGALAGCATPAKPVLTQEQMRTAAHSRAERGTRCYQSGRCRLPNSYMYDKEIIPRVRQAILADGRFSETSIWIEGQRRWVWLKGCVRTRAQMDALVKLVREIDDVESVVNELVAKPR